MRCRHHNLLPRFLPFLLALLVAVSAWTPGRAEAQMRCVGMPAHTAPCAQMNLPPAGLSDRQVSTALMMACCRSMQHSSRPSGLTPHAAPRAADHSSFAARHCLVTVRVAAARAAALGSRVRWFLTAHPALAPPPPAPTVSPTLSRLALGALSSFLSPHSQLCLHGLRAPPAA